MWQWACDTGPFATLWYVLSVGSLGVDMGEVNLRTFVITFLGCSRANVEVRVTSDRPELGRMSAPSTTVEETRLSTPSTAATAAKRSRESADPEHAFKTPRTALAGSSGSSAAAIGGLLAQLRANILALKAVDPSHIDEAQLMTAKTAQYLLGSFINGVEAQQEAIRNPPPVETPLNFDDMVHTLSFLDCESLAAASVVSRHWRRAAPEAVKFRLNHVSGAYSCFAFRFGQPPPTAQLLAQVERGFEETPALIQQLSLSQTRSEFIQTRDELKGVQKHVLRLHSNLLWEKVREAGLDASENKDAFQQRERLFDILAHAQLPEDELAPHAACVVDALRTSGATINSATNIYCLHMMSHMPAAVIEKHIDAVMLLMNKKKDNDHDPIFKIVQIFCLKAIAKLAPETLASLNLKAQIAATPLANSDLRSERERVANLLKTFPLTKS